MKTAISIPDDVFAKAEQVARSRGFTRSELFTKAVLFYLENGASSEDDKVDRINAVVDELGGEHLRVSDLARAQLNHLADEGW